MVKYNKLKNVTICKYFINSKCKYGNKCRLFHPSPANMKLKNIKKEIKRKAGHCYCGSILRNIVYNSMNYGPRCYNRSSLNKINETPLFIKVCSKTSKSMRKCM